MIDVIWTGYLMYTIVMIVCIKEIVLSSSWRETGNRNRWAKSSNAPDGPGEKLRISAAHLEDELDIIIVWLTAVFELR